MAGSIGVSESYHCSRKKQMTNTMYIAAAGTVSFDFREAGTIIGVAIVTNDAAAGACELSFNSTAQLTTHDTNGVVAGLTFTATGAQTVYVSPPMSEKVDAGERLYLHVTGANVVRAFIHTDSTGERRPPRRR